MAKIEIITLDGSISSSLNWKEDREKAFFAIGKGKKILWYLDFKLFKGLLKPISNEGQFQTLRLAIKHFKETIWNEFYAFSKGLLLYRGPADLTSCIPWNEELQNAYLSLTSPFQQKLFARDVFGDFLGQLAEEAPLDIPLFIEFDTLPENPLLKALLTHPERFKRFKVESDFSWNTFEIKEIGISFPPIEIVEEDLLKPFTIFFKKDIKLIPEEQLTLAWNGLNTLYYSKKCVSFQGLRKLQGFVAAGGILIEVDH